MKIKFLLPISALCALTFSCSKPSTPEDEVSSFLSQLGKDSLSLLSDSTIVVAKINQLKSTSKEIKTESYLMSDGITSGKKVNVTLKNGNVILLRFAFIGKSLYRINAFPLADNKTLWDSIISNQTQRLKLVGANIWEIDSQFKSAKVVYNDGYSNMNWSMEERPKDSPNYLQYSVDLGKAFDFYSQKINPVLADNSNATKFILDFRNGTVVVPSGKVWVIRKADNYPVVNKDFGAFDTSKTCQCVFKGALEQSAFLIVNGKCIKLGTLNPGIERSILPEGTSLCIPNSTVFNKDNGKNEYLFYNEFFIDEYNANDLSSVKELSVFIKSLGFPETDYAHVLYLNYLSAKQKPESIIME